MSARYAAPAVGIAVANSALWFVKKALAASSADAGGCVVTLAVVVEEPPPPPQAARVKHVSKGASIFISGYGDQVRADLPLRPPLSSCFDRWVAGLVAMDAIQHMSFHSWMFRVV